MVRHKYNSPVKNRSWRTFWPDLTPDLALDMEYIKEFSEQHLPTIPYYSLQTTQAELDPVHQEIEEHLKEWSSAISLVTFVRLNPTAKELLKWGIDDKRDVILTPAVVKLLDVGLATLSDTKDPTSDPIIGVKPGDLFSFDGQQYVVLDYHRESYHANYNKPMYIAISGEINRGASFGYETPVGDDE